MLRRNSSTIRAGGRVVGEVVDGKFVKRVRGSIHMLREPRGWGLDSESLAEAERLGASTVEIHDTESDVTYIASIDLVYKKGFDFDRGFGSQICLPLQRWSVRRPGDAQQLHLAIGVPS